MSEVLRKMAVNVPADSLCPKVSANNDISLACLLPWLAKGRKCQRRHDHKYRHHEAGMSHYLFSF